MSIPPQLHDCSPEDGEDLPTVAGLGFSLAQQYCGDCRDYHAVWGYLRLTGLVGGTFRECLLRVLSNAADRSGEGEWLIAGSADTALLSTVRRAIVSSAAPSRRVVILDLCPTPLKLCEAFARRHGMQVETHSADLTMANFPCRFNLILMDSVFSFILPAKRLAVLQAMHDWLLPGGMLVICGKYENPTYSPEKIEALAEHRVRAIEELAAAGLIALPEPGAAFADRVRRMTRQRRLHKRDHAELDAVEELTGMLRRAGFGQIEEHLLPAPVRPGKIRVLDEKTWVMVTASR